MKATPITDLIRDHQRRFANSHAAGSINTKTLAAIERIIDAPVDCSAETGCGKSTILFSHLSRRHIVFCLDDRAAGDRGSVNYFLRCPHTRTSTIETVYGPTQRSLPVHVFDQPLGLALIDGPHGFPFPELEYYHLYPHLAEGALLIVDDIDIPSIARFHAILREDEMFEPVKVINSKTAILRRTGAPTFDPLGDGWFTQRYNRRRVPRNSPFRDPRPLGTLLEEAVRRALATLKRGSGR